MSDLTPCPFCGAGQEELFVDTSYHGFIVSCENCSGRASMADWESRSSLVVKASQDRLAQLEAEVARLREALEAAIKAITDPRGLDDAICCSGHMCGCRGASHRDLLLNDLETMLARAALEPKP